MMVGTRISWDWAYRGFETCILENRYVRLTILPKVGAKIHEFVLKALDRNLLFQHPRVELRAPVFGANVDNWWTGGFDDAVPTGTPCEVDGEALPYLGEMWSLPWTVEQIAEDAVRCTRDGVITPLRIERTVRLPADASHARMTYRLTNLGVLPVNFIWGMHPGVPIGPATRLQVPGRRAILGESTPVGRLGPEGSERAWPIDELTVLPSRPGMTADLVYVTDLTSGWWAVWDDDWRAGIGMTFSTETFPAVCIWLADGGWRGTRCLAVEPWTAYPQRLDHAIAAGRATQLEPDESMEAECELIGFEACGTVRGFDGGAPVVSGR
jgi:hypothetical protein